MVGLVFAGVLAAVASVLLLGLLAPSVAPGAPGVGADAGMGRNGAPQAVQNFAPSSFLAPHRVQNIP